MTLYRNFCCIKRAHLWGWMGRKHFQSLLKARLQDGCRYPSQHPHNQRQKYAQLQFVTLFYSAALTAAYSLGIIDNKKPEPQQIVIKKKQ